MASWTATWPAPPWASETNPAVAAAIPRSPRRVDAPRQRIRAQVGRRGARLALDPGPNMLIRHDWTVSEARALYDLPLFDLVDRSRAVLLECHPKNEVQLCALLSVKTGGCPEDCGYCAQSSKHRVTQPEPMLAVDTVVERARRAKEKGSTRFCMGTAWRGARDGAAFDRVLEMIRGVRALGLETCVTLGLVDEAHARRLKEAGLDTYNHNLDTSREFFPKITSTRRFDDRIETIRNIRRVGISVCSGGIIGMGESVDDRCGLLCELTALDPHPDSVPINALVAIPGTPLESQPPVDPVDLVRMVAVARIMLPRSMVRLSAGRSELTREAQLFCLYAGANSIFYGEKLLTTPNVTDSADDELLRVAGLRGQAPAPH
jgi:biotin synthase